ncbi:unnamed protein product [Phytophthora lilii]|uniref:Unnamed protein product n=1 Tax=Phytophthora lilii TaxID=2077276 RepID=A0A9W6WVM7_9STRA|nr:unnamed protein product [Phytophthora lilii]
MVHLRSTSVITGLVAVRRTVIPQSSREHQPTKFEVTWQENMAFRRAFALMAAIVPASIANDVSWSPCGQANGNVVPECTVYKAPLCHPGICESPDSATRVTPDNFAYASMMDVAYGQISDAFLALCTEDRECSTRFKKKGIEATTNQGIADATVPHYCAFSLTTCMKLGYNDYDSNGINLLEALDGDNKKLITFQYNTGGSLIDTDAYSRLCGLSVIASYVQNNGDLGKLDTSCVDDDEVFALNWTTPTGYVNTILSTNDAYDGVFDKRLTADVSPNQEGSNDVPE